jgi:predicted secreted protein
VSSTTAALVGGACLAIAIMLGTVVNRMLPAGTARRGCEEGALLLGCAAPALAVFAPYLHRRLLAGVAVVAVAYGGFYLIRMRQLRRANRDAVRRLLGLERDSTFGEAASQAMRVEPAPVTGTGRIVLAAVAGLVVLGGYLLHRVDTALIGLALGAAEAAVRPAYHRALARRTRDIGH